MALIVGLLFLFFGFRLIIWIFQALLSLVGLLFRIWLFGVAAAIAVGLLAVMSVDGGDHADYAAPTHSALRQSSAAPWAGGSANGPAALTEHAWIVIAALALIATATGALWLLAYRKKRSQRIDAQVPQTASPKGNSNVAPKPNFAAPAISRRAPSRHPPAQKSKEPTAPPPSQRVELTAADLEAMAAFRSQHRWVVVDVPPRFMEAFLYECTWLQQKTKKEASPADQAAVLKGVSVGWSWGTTVDRNR